jgi:hypothetical protein
MYVHSEGKERSDEFSQQWMLHPVTPNISFPTLSFPPVNMTERRLQVLAEANSEAEADKSTGKDVRTDSRSITKQDEADDEEGSAPSSSILNAVDSAAASGASVLNNIQDSMNSFFSYLGNLGSTEKTAEIPKSPQSLAQSKAQEQAQSIKQAASKQQQQPQEQQQQQQQQQQSQKSSQSAQAVAPVAHKPAPVAYNTIVELGLFAGHMNSHPVGQMVLHRLVDIANSVAAVSASRAKAEAQAGSPVYGSLFRVTLVALPLVPDEVTSQIATKVQRIVNLPMDTKSAWNVLEKLRLDIILFPDWQPFPDVQAQYFTWKRMAPVQVCVFIRGTSCSSAAVDYYIMPEQDVSTAYLKSVPAADSQSSTIVKGRITQQIRPPWRELFAEQPVILQWPLLTNDVIRSIHASAQAQIEESPQQSEEQAMAKAHSRAQQAQHADPHAHNGMFAQFSEQEGQIFFEGQPVAIIAAHPTHVHPLMDDTIFKLMHAVSTLQVCA